jgi:DNA-directed RNA polymerase subunit alpha
LPVDAIFSPVRRVAYNVGRVRVGPVTDFDELVIEIWTDGSIEPGETLSTAAQILLRHLALIVDYGGLVVEGVEEVEEAIPPRIYEMPIEDLDLSVRAFNCLKRAGLTKVGEILEMVREGDEEMMAIRNFGKKSLDELKAALDEKGFLALIEEKAS